MARVTKQNVKPGMTIWWTFDDRPYDGYGWGKGIVTSIFDDHYLYTDLDNDIENIWGLYDEISSNVAFTTEEECLNFLKLGK